MPVDATLDNATTTHKFPSQMTDFQPAPLPAPSPPTRREEEGAADELNEVPVFQLENLENLQLVLPELGEPQIVIPETGRPEGRWGG